MKKHIKHLLYMSVVVALFASCKKDIDIVTLDENAVKAPKLTATESKIVLLESRETNTAVVFNWTKPSFNFNGSFKYTLQFAKAGTNFASPVNEAAGTDITKNYTEKAFNALILGLGIAPNAVGSIDVRLRAVLNDSVSALYSNTQTLVITPYPTDQILYVPGDYQGWAPASASLVRSVNKDKKYEGYIYFAGGSGEFKMTDAPDWNNGIFGDAGSGTSGNIAAPGNNFKVTPPGYYKINVNMKDAPNTWTAVKTSWGLIGDATPGGWGSDTDMTYDAASKKLTVTLNLVAGKIKFRANDDWGINLGDDGANGSLEYGGADIAVASGGNYTVTLAPNEAGRYTYVVKKN